MIRAKIVATGRYLPEKIVTNEDFAREFGNQTSPRVLERALGTREHRAAAQDEKCSDLLVKAAEKILNKGKIKARELTRIIISVTPGDYIEPATAPLVHERLGADCPAIDVRASCVGWLSGVDIALQYLSNQRTKEKILVLAGALMSRTLPVRLVQHRAIFGDGAGGVLITRTPANEKSCFYGTEFLVLGQYIDLIRWPTPWSDHPNNIPEEYHDFFYMGDSKILFWLLQKHIQQTLRKLWKKTGFSPKDVNLAVIHQPTGPLFEIAVKSSGISPEKVVRNFHRYGNTVSAELPIALDEVIEEGRIKRGDIILLISYGAGVTGGCALFRY